MRDLLQRHEIKLLPGGALVKTGPTDYPEANYQLVLGFIQRTRFRLATKLLGSGRVPRLLEIGSGSGVFLPELARHCEELYGIDVHGRQAAVADQLKRHGIAATLLTASAEALPLEDHAFDRVVAVSTLEFVENIIAVCREVRRVMREDGEFLVVTPGHSALIDLGYRMLTGLRCETLFEGRRTRTIGVIQQHFRLRQALAFPPFAPPSIRLYTAMRLVSTSTPSNDDNPRFT